MVAAVGGVRAILSLESKFREVTRRMSSRLYGGLERLSLENRSLLGDYKAGIHTALLAPEDENKIITVQGAELNKTNEHSAYLPWTPWPHYLARAAFLSADDISVGQIEGPCKLAVMGVRHFPVNVRGLIDIEAGNGEYMQDDRLVLTLMHAASRRAFTLRSSFKARSLESGLVSEFWRAEVESEGEFTAPYRDSLYYAAAVKSGSNDSLVDKQHEALLGHAYGIELHKKLPLANAALEDGDDDKHKSPLDHSSISALNIYRVIADVMRHGERDRDAVYHFGSEMKRNGNFSFAAHGIGTPHLYSGDVEKVLPGFRALLEGCLSDDIMYGEMAQAQTNHNRQDCTPKAHRIEERRIPDLEPAETLPRLCGPELEPEKIVSVPLKLRDETLELLKYTPKSVGGRELPKPEITLIELAPNVYTLGGLFVERYVSGYKLLAPHEINVRSAQKTSVPDTVTLLLGETSFRYLEQSRHNMDNDFIPIQLGVTKFGDAYPHIKHKCCCRFSIRPYPDNGLFAQSSD